jgi:hypothetical protein
VISPSAKPPIITATATIPAGQAVSNSIDLTAGNLTMLMTPTDWTPANVSFLVSEDNVTFRDLYDPGGFEIVKSMGPNRAINIDTSYSSGSLYLQIRSGPANNPVIQAADRIFTAVIQ